MSTLDGHVPVPEEFARRYRAAGYWRGDTLGALLRTAASVHPGTTGVVEGTVRWTWAEVDHRADRLAAGLASRGVGAGDRVLVQLPNVAAFVPLLFALARLGAVPALALPAHRDSEIRHLAELTDAVAYVVPDVHAGYDHRDLAATVLDTVGSVHTVVVVGDPGERPGFVSLGDVDGEPGERPGPEPADVAVLLVSGGTTGLPKLIPRTHDDYAYNARASAAVAGIGPDARYLAALPVAHNFPLACPGLLGTLVAGGTVVLAPDPSPDTCFALVEAERVTHAALVPPLAHAWLDAAAAGPHPDLSSLEVLQVGGARLTAEPAARVRDVLGCALQQVYGMAEGLLNFTRLDDPEELVVATQGRPLAADDELRVVGPDGGPVPPGTAGELLVRGPYTLRGYYRAPEQDAASFTADGFYRSGDLVTVLDTGHLVVSGRVKDVVNRGGDKVPVEEVENLLRRHPAVRDVAVVGVPDPTLGERTWACVVPRGEPPTRRELLAHLRALGIAAFKLPDRVRIVEELPRTGVGKIDRRALAAQVR